jgi:uncharacterized protein
MIGTLLNVLGILTGGFLGNLAGARLPDRLRQTVLAGLGLFSLGFGLQMFLTTKNALVVLGSILVGILLGEWLRIEDRLQTLGDAVQTRFIHREGIEGQRFVRGFLTAGVLFCVGPMAILGSIRDGLTGDYSILAMKAILDLFASLAFAASLGFGVLFSAALVLIYQGGLTLLAAQAQAWITPAMMTEMNATGGIILMGIALSSLLEIKKIRAGNFLPAIFLAPAAVAVLAALGVKF